MDIKLNKKNAIAFYKMAYKGDPEKAIELYVGNEYIQHNPDVEDGKKGFIQLISLLPSSYPGHSILTEDLGEIVNNSCECSSLGKKFKVHGRIKKAEIRGCSDI